MTKVKELEKLAKDNNHTLLSNSPLDKKYRYLFKCEKHNLEFKMTMTHFKRSLKGCSKCRTKLSKQGIYNRCLEKCKVDRITLLEYKPRAKDKLKLQCHCGSIWSPTHDNYIRKVNQCPSCSRKNLKGVYSYNYFIKFPEKKEEEAYIYFIYLEEHNVYKVGITTDLNNRLRKLPTNTLIQLYKTTLYNAFIVEQEVLATFKLEIKEYFQGHTECLTDNISKIIRFAHDKLRELGETLSETIPSQATK